MQMRKTMTILMMKMPTGKALRRGRKASVTPRPRWPGNPVRPDRKKLVELFDTGEVRAFRIRYPNGTVDVFRGWLSSLGKTVTSKEVMTRSVKITGVGRPSLAEEDTPDVVRVSGVTVAPASATVAAGATTTLTFTVKPDNASDKTLQVATADPLIATVTLKDNVATVKGVKAGSVNIVGISSDGSLVAVAAVTVTAS
ncbi:putative tail component of prophage [Salmonella enterica subsp. enterica]|uniref:Putative tail component of prophage n=1 Tax=Salmonella enterica I TaxID=59201 RepID=A0A3S4LZK5_SALET|nr:putative tail component of prophage [Salmonella enterica subsp. enterica]